MRKSVDELNQIPPDFAADRRQEMAALPDEFNRDPVKKPREKKRSSIWKTKAVLYLASAGIVTLGIITPIVSVNPEEPEAAAVRETPAPSIAAEATFVPAGKTDDTPSYAPSEKPAETAGPTAAPELSGKIHVVVYSEVFDAGGASYPSEVLADEMLDAATFREYRLPPLPEQEGYRAVGYVLTGYSGLAYLEGLYFDNADPGVIGTRALGDTLSVSDLLIVPKNADEVYEAEIHVVWLQEGSRFRLQFYDGELIGEYEVGFPLNSDGLCYLAVFPAPEREGKTFTGWSDIRGRMIDTVTYFDFFPEKADARTMEDREWSQPIPCRVYACWSDGTGGPPVTAQHVETPEPVSNEAKMCSISGDGCAIVVNGAIAENGTAVPAGTVVTAMAWKPNRTGRFIMTTQSGGTEQSNLLQGSPYEKYNVLLGSAAIWYMYSYTFTVTDDATISFSVK